VKRPDGWWLVRASNTEAVIVARAEASTDAALARLREEIVRELGEGGLRMRLD
jgi:phosphomannomutase